MRVLLCAPAQMLDDPVRIADRLAAEDGHGHDALTGERLDFLAVGLAPWHPDLVELHPLSAQLARDPPARAQPVRGRAAAVERGHYGITRSRAPPAVRRASPAR